MNNIVIIGNGAAGNSAAETIRRHNTEVPIIMMARENLPAYSACALPDCLSGWVDRSHLFIKQMQDYSRLGITAEFGCSIKRIDTGQRLVITDQGTIPYGRLIIATGSRAVIPPVPGSDRTGNFVVKTVSDIDNITAHRPRRVLVVGSGNIGVEVAEALQMRGCEVTIVELMDYILPRIFDEKPARQLGRILTAHGIRLITGERVIGVDGGKHVEAAFTQQRTIACDTIIWAAGVKQNVELAQAAGIKLGNLGGIQVDSHLQTNIEGVYACGDCIESIDRLTGNPALSLLWPSAKRQGQVAALNCLGRATAYEGSVNLVIEDIYGTTAVSMGMPYTALLPRDITVWEGQTPGEYWRVLTEGELIMGMQAIGVNNGLGAVMTLMKKRISLSQFRQTAADPNIISKSPWFLPARRFLEV